MPYGQVPCELTEGPSVCLVLEIPWHGHHSPSIGMSRINKFFFFCTSSIPTYYNPSFDLFFAPHCTSANLKILHTSPLSEFQIRCAFQGKYEGSNLNDIAD